MGNCQSSSAVEPTVVPTQGKAKSPPSSQKPNTHHHHEQQQQPKVVDGTADSTRSIEAGAVATATGSVATEPTVATTTTDTAPAAPSLMTEESSERSDAKKRWQYKKGYSSGASSSGEELESSASMHARTISDRSHDPLRLESMRNLMHANGTLTEGIVRLEVRGLCY